jgi:hypothetical protein
MIGARQTREGYARLNVGAPDARRPHAEGNFPTPSGKCEFAGTAAHEGGRMLEVYRQGCSASDPGGAVDPLPDIRQPVLSSPVGMLPTVLFHATIS